MKANGAFTDSLNAYFHRSVGLAAIGLVGVGDAYGLESVTPREDRETEHVEGVTHQQDVAATLALP